MVFHVLLGFPLYPSLSYLPILKVIFALTFSLDRKKQTTTRKQPKSLFRVKYQHKFGSCSGKNSSRNKFSPETNHPYCLGLGTVTHFCNFSYWVGEGLWFKATPGKKLVRPTISINKLGMVVTYVYNLSYAGGIGRRIKVWAGQDKKQDPT
jgi:hypothetical protein